MKILLLAFFFLLPSLVLAQQKDINIPIDSLIKYGYRVHIYKPRTRTIVIVHRDTVYIPRPEIVYVPQIVRDTITNEKSFFNSFERATERTVIQIPEQKAIETIRLAIIGGANTNGYDFSVGTMIGLGSHLSFFIGGGAGYNSVTKVTHLDISGLIIIAL